MTKKFYFWQKLVYICFDQMIWFDKKFQYGYSDLIEDMKGQDHLKFYGRKIIFETISHEQEIPNLVLYRSQDIPLTVPLMTSSAEDCIVSNSFLND